MSDPVTQEDFDEVLDEFQEATVEILSSKGEEYATDEDRLMNFRTVGDMAGMEPEEVTVTYLLKHVQRLSKAVRTGEYEWDWQHDDGSEALKQRVADSINYLYLLALALEAADDDTDHRLADAEPATQPDDAPRDDNGDPEFDEH